VIEVVNLLSYGTLYLFLPSNVVTPKTFFALYTPIFFKVSANIGTVELTGLLIIKNIASGQNFPHASASPLTMPAFVLKRSYKDDILSYDIEWKN